MKRRTKLTHIITGLNVGGAEIMLANLVLRMDPLEFDNEIISLLPPGPIGSMLVENGVRIRTLGMSNRYADLARTVGRIFTLRNWLRERPPDVIQTWLSHSDLIGSIAARAVPDAHIVWGIHQSVLTAAEVKRTTLATIRACAPISWRIPSRIVCCSNSSRAVHKGLGYCGEKMEVIYNGFDTQRFKPCRDLHTAVRVELGLKSDDFVIGMIARFDPVKDHQNLMRAAAIAARQIPNLRIVLSGNGMSADNPALAKLIAESGCPERFLLLGLRKDVDRIYNALDIGTLSSCTEAFPLFLGETMSSGIPFVATAVGDCPDIIGNTGIVVPPKNPTALAEAWKQLSLKKGAELHEMGAAARMRVAEQFSIDRSVTRYSELYRKLVN
jgi:glycosyltransferase involved in cell wall biosynthesis